VLLARALFLKARVSIGRFHLPRRRGIWDREYDKNNVSLRNELPSAGIVRVPQRQTQLRLHSWRSAASVYLGMPARTHAVRSESYRVRVRNEHHVAPRQYRRRFLPPIAAATLRPIATAPWNSPGGAFPLSPTLCRLSYRRLSLSLSLSLSPDRSRTRESARYRTLDARRNRRERRDGKRRDRVLVKRNDTGTARTSTCTSKCHALSATHTRVRAGNGERVAKIRPAL